MKKVLSAVILIALLLSSCTGKPTDVSSSPSGTESETVSETVSETSSVNIVDSSDNSSLVSSQDEGYDLHISAKTAVERIMEEVSLSSDTVELDSRFLSEKMSVSSDMYDDFYGLASYEISDVDLVAVFGCKTVDGAEKIRKLLSDSLKDGAGLSYLSPYAKIISVDGYTVFIATESKFDEESLASKLLG